MKKIMKKAVIIYLCIMMIVIFPQEAVGATPDYFENPNNIYKKFEKQIYNQQYQVKYAFLKESAPVYSDLYGSEKIGRAPKYSGVMVVSGTDAYVQVIFEKKKGYGIGWMKRKKYKEISSLYNGAEKQLLADGAYIFYNVNSDNDLETVLKFQGNQQYVINFSDDKNDFSLKQWKLVREYDHFYIQDVKTGKYLSENQENQIKLVGLKQNISNRFGKTDDQGPVTCQWKVKRNGKNVKPYRNFLQYDPAWARKDYGNVSDYSGKMAAAGCGVVAITNAVYALNGQFIDPVLLADYAVEKEYRIIGSGTDDGIFQAAARQYGDAYGFYYVGTTHSTLRMKDYLKRGCVAVSHVPGHYVTIADFNPKNKKYLVLDSHPIQKRPTNPFGNWFLKHRLESGGLASSGYYIYSPVKNMDDYKKITNINFLKNISLFILPIW